MLPRHSARSVSNVALADSPVPTQPLKENKPPSELYMRDLPNTCIDWSSKEGRDLFREALCLGGLECYFPLAAQFSTQAEPAFCGLGTLAMVLNALNIDPGRVWKGPWRWYHEGMLDCCVPLQVVERRGISIDTFACLARCNGAAASVARTETEGEEGLDAFREAVINATSRQSGSFLIASYSRAVLGQTGDGHFSPIGGYHPEKDLVLVLDVARFKYPPHWVPLKMLYKAMQSVDPDTGRTRGYITVSRSAAVPLVLFVFGDRNQQGFWPQQSPPRKAQIFQQQKLFANEFHTAAGPFPTVTSEWTEPVSPSACGIHTHACQSLNTTGLASTCDTPFGSPTSRSKHTMNNNHNHAAVPSRSQSTYTATAQMEPAASPTCCPVVDDDSLSTAHGSNCQGQGRSIAGAAYQLRQASRVLDAAVLQWPEDTDDVQPLSSPISALNESIAESMEATGKSGNKPTRRTTPPIQAALKCAIHALLCGGGAEMNTGVLEASPDEEISQGRAALSPSSTPSIPSAHTLQGSPVASSFSTVACADTASRPTTVSARKIRAMERVCSAQSCNLHETNMDETASSSSSSTSSDANVVTAFSSGTVSTQTTTPTSSRKLRDDLVSPKCFTRLSREQVAAVGALLEDLETLPLYRAIKAELTEGETGVVTNCEHAATSCVKVSTAHMVSILLLTLYSNGDPFSPLSVLDAATTNDGVTNATSSDPVVTASTWETQMQKLLAGEFDNLDIDSVLSSHPLRPSSSSTASDLLSSIVLSSLDHSTPLIRSEVALLRSQMDLQLSMNGTSVH